MRIAVVTSGTSAAQTSARIAARSPAVKQVQIPACGGARQALVNLLDGSSATCWEGDQVGRRPPRSNSPRTGVAPG
jgi:hypothetical protein